MVISISLVAVFAAQIKLVCLLVSLAFLQANQDMARYNKIKAATSMVKTELWPDNIMKVIISSN
jgi:hypothetical protein